MNSSLVLCNLFRHFRVVYSDKIRDFAMPDNPTQPCKKAIAAIVPTYNEALNVAGVLKVLQNHPHCR